MWGCHGVPTSRVLVCDPHTLSVRGLRVPSLPVRGPRAAAIFGEQGHHAECCAVCPTATAADACQGPLLPRAL